MWMFGGSEGVCGCVGAGGQINWSHVIHAQVSHMLAGGYSSLFPCWYFSREAQLVQKSSRDPHAGAIAIRGC